MEVFKWVVRIQFVDVWACKLEQISGAVKRGMRVGKENKRVDRKMREQEVSKQVQVKVCEESMFKLSRKVTSQELWRLFFV